MSAARELLQRHRIVPVVTVDDADEAVPVARALVDGGIGAIELTLRTPAAWRAIELIAAADTGIELGVGTVVNAAQAERAIAAGASFLVSPGLDESAVALARDKGVPFVPGVATATEMQRALGAGCDTVKLFPAHLLGGPAAVSAFAAPFPQLRFLPSGGVGPQNAAEYLALAQVDAVSGSWMIDRDARARRDGAALTASVRHAVRSLESA